MRYIKTVLLLFIFPIIISCSNESDDKANKIESKPATETAAKENTEQLALLWETAGFNNPESVIYDKNHDVFYVSNVNGGPTDVDGNGTIAKVLTTGEIIDLNWVTGLNAPKGLGLHPNGDLLYVSDITELVEINIHSASISNRYPIEDAAFMNDVDVAADGSVYVSDMPINRIYKMQNNEISIWLESELLNSPNGILIEDNVMIIGTWGKMTDGFATEVPGNLIAVDMHSQKIAELGDGASIGNMDGVESDGEGGYTSTDWMNGKLFHITGEGVATKLLDLSQGSADHEVVLENNILLIPMMKDNVLKAYRYP